VVISVLSAALYFVSFSGMCCAPPPRPPSILGMTGGVPTTVACGSTVGALYKESVSITNSSSTFTTDTLGLKVVPTGGGSTVPDVAPPASGSPCPASGGYYVALEDPNGSEVACWTGVSAGGAPVWSSPYSYTCINPNGAVLGSPIAISEGQSLIVFMYGRYVPPMGGTYTLQAYGLSYVDISGSVDL
jgi:hypothetical protein